MTKQNQSTLGASAWWILMISILFSGLFYLAIWSVFNQNPLAGFIGSIFMVVSIIGIILSYRIGKGFEIFQTGTWGRNCLGFTVGFIIWFAIGSLSGLTAQSLLSVSENGLFASISSVLPTQINFVMNVFAIPLAEEIFWMFALAGASFSILSALSKKYKIFGNVFVQIGITAVIGGITFAIFHVGKIFVSFLIAAFIFRAIMMGLVFSDIKADIIKGFDIMVSFAVGAHIGNNLADYGISQAWSIIVSNFFPLGLLVILFFVVMFVSSIDELFDIIGGKSGA